MFPTPKEWKDISWNAIAYEEGDILAYAMPKEGQFLLTRFDNHFNIKTSTKTKTEWHVANTHYADGTLHAIIRTSGEFYHYEFDGKTLEMKNKELLFHSSNVLSVDNQQLPR